LSAGHAGMGHRLLYSEMTSWVGTGRRYNSGHLNAAQGQDINRQEQANNGLVGEELVAQEANGEASVNELTCQKIVID